MQKAFSGLNFTCPSLFGEFCVLLTSKRFDVHVLGFNYEIRLSCLGKALTFQFEGLTLTLNDFALQQCFF